MRILAVDTSSERSSICITVDGVVLGEIRLAMSGQHAEQLFRSVEFLLASLPIALADIDLFVAARGPGSFTGLRVGLAAMEGFAAADGRRGAGLSTLEALAYKAATQLRREASFEAGLISPVIDARRGEVYGGLYRWSANRLVEERAPSVLPPESWFASLATIKNSPDVPIYFCGDGALRYRSSINQSNWRLCEMDLFLAVTMAHLAETTLSGPLEPLYVRKTDAEIAREAKG